MNEVKQSGHNIELDKLTDAQKAELLADLSKGGSLEVSGSLENNITGKKISEEPKEVVSVSETEHLKTPNNEIEFKKPAEQDSLSHSEAKQVLTDVLNNKANLEDLVVKDPEALTNAINHLKKAA